jgi:hypothetical protein
MILGEDYSPAGSESGSGVSPPKAPFLPVEGVIELIQEAASKPTPRSAATILRLIDEQARPVEGRHTLKWIIAIGLVLLAIPAAIMGRRLFQGAELAAWLIGLASLGAVSLAQWRHQPVASQWREEMAAMEREAAAALIHLSRCDLAHAGLHADRVKTGHQLARGAGDEYAAAFATILRSRRPAEDSK